MVESKASMATGLGVGALEPADGDYQGHLRGKEKQALLVIKETCWDGRGCGGGAGLEQPGSSHSGERIREVRRARRGLVGQKSPVALMCMTVCAHRDRRSLKVNMGFDITGGICQ